MIAGLDANISWAFTSISSSTSNPRINWIFSQRTVSSVLTTQILTFAVAKAFGVAVSLFVRVCSRDGEGINFNLSVQTTANTGPTSS